MKRPSGWAITWLMLVCAGPISAQAVKATEADSVVVATNIYERLFAGVTLSKDARALALAIIRKGFLVQLKVASHGEYQDVKPELTRLLMQRDSALKALIKSEAEKKTFERHAMADRP